MLVVMVQRLQAVRNRETFLLSRLGIPALAAVVLSGIIFYSIILSKPVASSLIREYQPRPLGIFLFSLFVSLLVVCGISLSLPLLLLYFAVYLCNCVGLWILLPKMTPQAWFCNNILCVHVMSIHQFALSVTALWIGKSPYQIYTDPGLSLLIVSVILLVVFGLFLVMKRLIDLDHAEGLADVIARQREIGFFLWFAMGYVAFDSIPCMFDLPYRQVSRFLLGSCVLLWVQLYLFLGYAYRVFMRQHFEHEYHLLEQQQLEHHSLAMKLRKMAYTDALTGVYTRSYAMKLLHQWVNEQRTFSLVYIDLNGLKWVNDTFGHKAGDDYLIAVTEAVSGHLRANDVFVRIGGDEFLVLMPDVTESAASAVMDAAEKRLTDIGKDYVPSFSYGVERVSSDQSLDVGEIIHRADVRMYEDKKRRKHPASERGKEE